MQRMERKAQHSAWRKVRTSSALAGGVCAGRLAQEPPPCTEGGQLKEEDGGSAAVHALTLVAALADLEGDDLPRHGESEREGERGPSRRQRETGWRKGISKGGDEEVEGAPEKGKGGEASL